MIDYIRLYKKTINDHENVPVLSFSDYGYSLVIFKPTLFRLVLRKTVGTGLLLNYIISLGRIQILYLMDGRKVVHYSIIMPKIYRYPFMGPKDLMIGTCFTDINYRNLGIYTRILKMIPQIYKESTNTFWIYTLQSNITSQRIIEKTGYNFCYLLKKYTIFKILKRL